MKHYQIVNSCKIFREIILCKKESIKDNNNKKSHNQRKELHHIL